MKVVVGGTEKDYREWLRSNEASPSQARHVTRTEQLLGLELAKEDIVRLGYLSPEGEQILLTRIRRLDRKGDG